MANIEIDNYTIHKQLFQKVNAPSDEKLEKLLTNVGAWFSTSMDCNYYMVMCKEKSDFTVLHFNNMNYSKGMKELKDLLESRGTILDITYVHSQDAYECWVRDEDEEVSMYYLFPYFWGVIEVS